MINVDEDRQRAAFMEFLYSQSGRTCSTYTGLWQEYMKEGAEASRDDWWEAEKRAQRAQ